jgi:hypothetical protein
MYKTEIDLTKSYYGGIALYQKTVKVENIKVENNFELNTVTHKKLLSRTS